MSNLPLEISVGEVKAMLDAGDDFLLLDCREESEYAIVKIADTELLPMSQIQARVGELMDHRDKRVVIHCHHGGRSAQVATWLRESHGFSQAQSMAGGVDSWAVEIEPGLPRY